MLLRVWVRSGRVAALEARRASLLLSGMALVDSSLYLKKKLRGLFQRMVDGDLCRVRRVRAPKAVAVWGGCGHRLCSRMRSGGTRGLVGGICGGEDALIALMEVDLPSGSASFVSFDDDKLDLFEMSLEIGFGMVRCVREIPGTRDYA